METQNVTIQVVNENAVIAQMAAQGWHLIGKSNWSADHTTFVGTFERESRTQLNG